MGGYTQLQKSMFKLQKQGGESMINTINGQ